MKPTSCAPVDEFTPTAEIRLDDLYKPIEEQLSLTQSLYNDTVLQSAERNYIHQLLSEEESIVQKEYRVDIADKIAEHLLQSRGKWIRASMVLLCAKACGVESIDVRQLAVAVELVHLATLIHDDIIDQADIRRGIASVQCGWGNSIAVLMGDFLYSKAFKLLLSSDSIKAQTLLAKATGQMCLGEIKQLRFNGNGAMTEPDYLEMIENKTASLMSAATASGGVIGGLSDEMVERLHEYGHAVGMAFQIADDILDYTSSTSELGKEQGGDLRNGKTTLPLIHLFQKDGENAHSILNSNGSIEHKTEQILSLMEEFGSIKYAYEVGQKYGSLAKKNLQAIKSVAGESEALTSLTNLVDFVLNRKR